MEAEFAKLKDSTSPKKRKKISKGVPPAICNQSISRPPSAINQSPAHLLICLQTRIYPILAKSRKRTKSVESDGDDQDDRSKKVQRDKNEIESSTVPHADLSLSRHSAPQRASSRSRRNVKKVSYCEQESDEVDLRIQLI